MLYHIVSYYSYAAYYTVSQKKETLGSVATHLRWGGIFIDNFVALFQLSTSVKELWKSVNI